MSTPKRSRLSRTERRAQLIQAAADAFLATGYEGTSMEDVARAAGVSRLIVYRNFESKAELYRAVLDSVLVELGHAFAETEVPARETVRVMLPIARANAAAFRLLWRHAAHDGPFTDRAELLRERVYAGARTAFAPFVSDPVRLDWAARAGGAHLIDAICTWIDVGEPARDDETATVIDQGLQGLARAWADAG